MQIRTLGSLGPGVRFQLYVTTRDRKPRPHFKWKDIDLRRGVLELTATAPKRHAREVQHLETGALLWMSNELRIVLHSRS